MLMLRFRSIKRALAPHRIFAKVYVAASILLLGPKFPPMQKNKKHVCLGSYKKALEVVNHELESNSSYMYRCRIGYVEGQVEGQVWGELSWGDFGGVLVLSWGTLGASWGLCRSTPIGVSVRVQS